MFLLARLILDNLEGTGSREDVEEELATETLPQGINQAWVSQTLRHSTRRFINLIHADMNAFSRAFEP